MGPRLPVLELYCGDHGVLMAVATFALFRVSSAARASILNGLLKFFRKLCVFGADDVENEYSFTLCLWQSMDVQREIFCVSTLPQ